MKNAFKNTFWLPRAGKKEYDLYLILVHSTVKLNIFAFQHFYKNEKFYYRGVGHGSWKPGWEMGDWGVRKGGGWEIRSEILVDGRCVSGKWGLKR